MLEAAWESGITHFDVAPIYGLGAAERELGDFVSARREHVVVATKFGIDVARRARALNRMQGPIRHVLEARPGLRASARAKAGGPVAGRAGALLYVSSGYTRSAARTSLERSLRALRTDHVDLLLLHDPTIDQMPVDDVGEYLEAAMKDGMIGTWGVAGEPAATLRVAEGMTTPPRVLQIRDDVFIRSLERLPPKLAPTRITFGSLGSAIRRIVTYLTERPEARERWRRLVGLDCADREVVAGLLLRHARRTNPSGITLFSTIHVERLDQATSAATSTSLDEQLEPFLKLVDAELASAAPVDRR